MPTKTAQPAAAPEEPTPAFTTEVAGDDLMVTFRNGSTRAVSLTMDMDSFFDFLESSEAMDQELANAGENAVAAMRIMRSAIPADFRTAMKGIDMPIAFEVFQDWSEKLGERMGKALS